MDFILEEMNRYSADGVDFLPICFGKDDPPIICSYTKDEWINGVGCCPKSDRRYWKMINGKKIYCK